MQNDCEEGNRLGKSANDSRSQELGLITGKEDEEELKKCKQRLTDEVRHEMRRARQGTRKRK